MLFAALILCFALLAAHASKCLMFCAGFLARQSQHNLNLDKCSPNSCTRLPSVYLSVRPSVSLSLGLGSKFTHISDTKPMLDGRCYWMLPHKLCVFRSSLGACLCVCRWVGEGVWVCLTHHWTVTQQQQEQHMSVGGPVGRQIPFDVQSAERQRQWSMQKVFQTVQFGSVRFDFGSSVRFSSVFVTLPVFLGFFFGLRLLRAVSRFWLCNSQSTSNGSSSDNNKGANNNKEQMCKHHEKRKACSGG